MNRPQILHDELVARVCNALKAKGNEVEGFVEGLLGEYDIVKYRPGTLQIDTIYEVKYHDTKRCYNHAKEQLFRAWTNHDHNIYTVYISQKEPNGEMITEVIHRPKK